jgi:hypothetical protein
MATPLNSTYRVHITFLGFKDKLFDSYCVLNLIIFKSKKKAARPELIGGGEPAWKDVQLTHGDCLPGGPDSNPGPALLYNTVRGLPVY